MNPELVDRIVSGVLAQLRDVPAGAAPSPASPPANPAAAAPTPAAPTPAAPAKLATAAPTPSSAIAIQERVITAATLQGKVPAGGRLLLASTSILTPSARDFLKSQRITIERAATGAAPATGPVRPLLLQAATPAVEALRKMLLSSSGAPWRPDWSGTLEEAVTTTTKLIATAEAKFVACLTDAPQRFACLANRQSAVRAAALSDRADWADIKQQLDPNVIAIDVRDRSLMELRNTLEALTRPLPAIKSATPAPSWTSRLASRPTGGGRDARR